MLKILLMSLATLCLFGATSAFASNGRVNNYTNRNNSILNNRVTRAVSNKKINRNDNNFRNFSKVNRVENNRVNVRNRNKENNVVRVNVVSDQNRFKNNCFNNECDKCNNFRDECNRCNGFRKDGCRNDRDWTRDDIYGQYGANIFGGLMAKTGYDSMVKDGGYTMFVPSDDSLRNMSSDDYNRWVAQNGDFSSILGSHIIRDRISSNQFNRTVISINGNRVVLTVVNGRLFVNGHRVIRVERFNGNVIYIVSGDIATPVVY